MYKKYSLLFSFIMLSVTLFAQSTKVSGIVEDTTSKAHVKNAVVALLTPVDSVIKKFVRSNSDGSFSFNDVKPGNYILMVMHPTFADLVDNIEVNGETKDLGIVSVTPKSKLLAEVIIKTGSPIRIKGDTTIYTADSFKVSANANVEELLKKLPGIQVDKNGQIKAMGETVEKVLVDGEEFFGDDPGMAVKNLRADAVKEVQVFDKKSDQAEFTGIDDGQTKKTINLKLKENKKSGYFGKISLSGGLMKDIDHRYNNNLMFSSFKGKRKISGFLLNGNTGQDGLSWQDNEKYGGESDNYSMSMDDDGGMMFMWRGGGSDDEPYVNTDNGYIKNVNAGIQYSNKWNDKTSVNFSPKYNSQIYSNNQYVFRQQQLKDALGKDIQFNTNSAENTNVNRHNFKLRGIYDVKIDSMNTLKITANANFYHTESASIYNSDTKDNNGDLLNINNSDTKTKSDKTALSANVIFKHKFRKARRTLSFTTDLSNLSTVGETYLKTYNQSFDASNPFIQDLDRFKDNSKSSSKVLSRLVYTEPLSKKYSMEIGYEFSYNKGKNDLVTYNYSPTSQKWDDRVDSLTNDFDQAITINKPSVKLNYADKKFKINIGSGFGLTHFDLIDNTVNKDYKRNYTNFFPTANINYTYKSNHNLRISYNGSTAQPTVNQLQPLRNNDDQFNQYIGNPDLKPSFSNNFNISHNSYNFLKDMWMYQSLNIQQTTNSITNQRIINYGSGQTVTQPINTNGNVSIQFWGGVGFKIKKIDTRFNINPNISYTKFSDIINNVKSYSKNTTTGLNLWISKSKDKKYDISIGEDFSYNSNKTAQSSSKINYFVNTLSADVTVYIHKVWSISTDYQFYARQKTEQFNSNLTNSLWNAKLQKTFKNNEFTAFIRVRDILNQNIGIERSFYSNTLTEQRNDRLKRYWMIGFTWDFKNKGAAAAK